MILIHIRKCDELSNEFPETRINLDRVDSFHFNVEYKYLRMSMGDRDYYILPDDMMAQLLRAMDDMDMSVYHQLRKLMGFTIEQALELLPDAPDPSGQRPEPHDYVPPSPIEMS